MEFHLIYNAILVFEMTSDIATTTPSAKDSTRESYVKQISEIFSPGCDAIQKEHTRKHDKNV